MSKIENNKYDLEERTLKFSKNIISLCKQTPYNSVTKPIISQLIRSGTSIGANYKEARETKYWQELLAHSDEKLKDKCREIWKEAQELTLIFSTIAKNTN